MGDRLISGSQRSLPTRAFVSPHASTREAGPCDPVIHPMTLNLSPLAPLSYIQLVNVHGRRGVFIAKIPSSSI